jgi:hypothetical protein
MSFDPPARTRGACQPRGTLMRWLNKVPANRIRRKGGKAIGMSALALPTIGRKSGAARTSSGGELLRTPYRRSSQETPQAKVRLCLVALSSDHPRLALRGTAAQRF